MGQTQRATFNHPIGMPERETDPFSSFFPPCPIAEGIKRSSVAYEIRVGDGWSRVAGAVGCGVWTLILNLMMGGVVLGGGISDGRRSDLA